MKHTRRRRRTAQHLAAVEVIEKTSTPEPAKKKAAPKKATARRKTTRKKATARRTA